VSIEKHGAMPAHAQLADLLRSEIQDNEYPDGHRLPSLPELVTTFGVSISVVRQALQQLESEGLITTRQGKGSVVRRPKRHLRDGMTRHLRSQRPARTPALEAEASQQGQGHKGGFRDVGNVPAPPEVAEALGVRPGTNVLRRRYVLSIDGVPAELCSSYFRHDLAEGTALVEPKNIPGGTHNLLAEELGFDLTHAPEVLFARMPTPSEVRDLRLLPGTPVVELFRTFMTRDDQCVEASVWVFAGDRHKFRYVTPMD
jgi:GntR family transcriptional regulator